MKLFLKTVLSIVLIFMLLAGGGVFFLTRGLEAGSNLKVNDVNLSSLSDGTYSGQYNDGRWSNQLSVTIKDHKITKIEIVKDVIFPKEDVAEQLFNNVVEKQNTDVDAISGATITSKAYLKSIENALKN